LRREVIPNISRKRIGRQRAAGIGLQQRNRYAALGRQIIVVEKVVGHDHGRHLLFEVVGLGPGPVLIPVLFIDVGRRLGNLARMATGAILSEGHLAPVQFGLVLSQVLAASWRVLEQIRLCGLEKKNGYVRCLCHRCIPVTRIPFGVLDLDRRNLLASDERIEVQQPFLAKQSDIDKDAIERAEKSNRIGSIFEHTRRPYGIRRFVKLRERHGLRKILELLVF
jgi:hypothetical protein